MTFDKNYNKLLLKKCISQDPSSELFLEAQEGIQVSFFSDDRDAES